MPSKAFVLALVLALALNPAPRVSGDGGVSFSKYIESSANEQEAKERDEEAKSKGCSQDTKCCEKGNRARYTTDDQCWKDTDGNTKKGTNETGYMPLTCQVPDNFCNCSSKVWRVGPWAVKTPVPTYYVGKNTGQTAASGPNPQPYIFGVKSRAGCCAACQSPGNAIVGGKKTYYCAYWLHFVPSSPISFDASCGNTDPSTFCGYCIIYPPGAPGPMCSNATSCKGESEGDDHYYKASDYATVGKGCPGGKNDPHFVGAAGTHFDFNGVPDQSFCLVTDPKYQINMKMRGYYDSRTIGASVLSNGKAVRTWIKDLGIMWTDPASGVHHTLRLAARDGKEQARGLGYMGAITIDGAELPRMKAGESINGPAGLEIRFTGYEKEGGGFFDVDTYDVSIAGMMSVEVKLRIAHPLLQTADDAMTHINVRFMYLEHSTQTHGVLGQTFRSGREQRTVEYHSLAALLGRDLPADTEVAKGFLDGSAADYKTSHVLASDCAFSANNGQELPAAV